MKKYSVTLQKILEILQDGHYHDGTSIGQSLQLSRTAIWKNIQKLESYHIKVLSTKNKGYALAEPFIPLNEAYLQKHVDGHSLKIDVFESLPSTHTYLKSIASKIPHVCVAEEQTDGRGRFERNWYAPFGQNIYLSMRYSFQKDVSELSGLSLMIGLSLLKSLNKFFNVSSLFFLKWPNDILYKKKKLGGVLLEIQAEAHGASSIIIGIGLNVNMKPHAYPDPSFEWTSLYDAFKTYINRNDLCLCLIDTLLDDLTLFDKEGFKPFFKEWPKSDALAHQQITFTQGNKKRSGIAKGINSLGHLLIEQEGKSLEAFSSGDTAFIRPLKMDEN